ncbi:MAG TPA: dihydrofolate reductase family protein [Flavobacteriales bacterium]|nr:dihydrofolate reductase family protein [Flavobacteriales bacterium]HMU14704.1 dihydrofolate reductase family protein [Flavobacteriales bacterium]HMW97337.1 dihydrofolate reductase family protein [Flavobacteriales bacterium]HNA33513.1 dihydrofolate reductase family protein [Flavobacteriales bacterium]HNI03653.1 dihydrofolate reductase family protein [Flavobacteriales bacterium]
MRPLRFSINVTLDGCYDHTVGIPDEGLHRNAEAYIAGTDAMLLGRKTYQLMESAWRMPPSGQWPDWMPLWMQPFARTMDAAKKYLVSSTVDTAEWNTVMVRGDLATFVRQLKQQPGKGIGVGGVQLAHALTEMGLIDEYQIVVHPRIAGRGPTLFAGLSKMVDLKLVGREEFSSGAVALRYEVRKP